VTGRSASHYIFAIGALGLRLGMVAGDKVDERMRLVSTNYLTIPGISSIFASTHKQANYLRSTGDRLSRKTACQSNGPVGLSPQSALNVPGV
jgi:hypothetical protein